MFVVTFYSYKGGVGRTLALMNCASRLAREGRKVFILDFDLEAPGVDGFRLCGNGEPRKGIVEYVSRFTGQGSVETIDDYVYQIDAEHTGRGTIHFMPAGRKDTEYQALLSKLDWKYFYSRQKGYLFVENLKAAIEQRYAPDYVLIDSRTGLTDVSGICTLQLPNLVVLVFNLNNQNVSGISRSYRSIRENRLNREIKTLLVASPIPDMPDYIKIRKERIALAQAKIGAEQIDMILPFDPFVAFEETVLVGGEQGTHLAKSYDGLTRMIQLENKLDVSTMLGRARKLEDQGSIDLADLKYLELLQTYPDEPKALKQYARFLRIRGNSDAVTYLERARELDPEDPTLLGQLVRAQLSVGRTANTAQYIDEFLRSEKDAEEIADMADVLDKKGQTDAAIRLYDRSIELADPADVTAHLALGNIYMRLDRLDLAMRQYEIGVRIDPVYLPTLYNYAYSLYRLKDPRADNFFRRAIEVYEKRHPSGHDEDDNDDEKANQYQAMCQAYAVAGARDKAEELRGRAIEIAAAMPPEHLLFSSLQYRLIPAWQFIQETRGLSNRV